MFFEFRAPTRLIFGEGSFGQLGQVVAQHGTKALLVTGRRALIASGHVQRAQEMLSQAGVTVKLFSEINANPTTDIVDRGGQVARDAGCDVIIGLGGGSAMDAAKAIAIAATHELPTRRFLEPGPDGQKASVTSATLPIICVTSTAGTSSELTPFSVLTISDTHEKSAIRSDYIQPRAAFADPELTYLLPADITASTGIDVLCHALETFVSTMATPITDLTSQEAIRLVGKYLPLAYADGANVEARRQMLLANVFAGYSLACCGTTIMHGLEHPVSGHYPQVAHGAGLAALLRPWARKVWQHAPEKMARVTELLGQRTAGMSTLQAAEQAEEALDTVLQAVDLQVRLRDLGVEADNLATMAADTCRYMAVSVTKTPGGLSCHDVQELLEAAF